MHFLRTVFWVVAALAMLVFAVRNNRPVTVNLWGGLQADVKIWLLVLGPLLLGFLPTWILGRVRLWRERRQASAAAQRALEAQGYDYPGGRPAAAVPIPEPGAGAAPHSPPSRITVSPAP